MDARNLALKFNNDPRKAFTEQFEKIICLHFNNFFYYSCGGTFHSFCRVNCWGGKDNVEAIQMCINIQ